MDDGDFDETELFATFEGVGSGNKNGISSKPQRKKSVDDTEIELLKNENTQLKKVLRRISYSCQSNESPVASIVYFDRRHGNPANIEELIKHFAQNSDREKRDDVVIVSNEVEPCLEQHSSFYDNLALALGDNKDSLPSGSIQYYTSYCLDSFGSSVIDLSTIQRYNYEQVYFNILPIINGQGKAMRPKSMCFNCDGDHKLPECTQPRNLARISAKRQDFMSNFSSPKVQEARYHADKEKQEKFQHLVAGKMTSELRNALGLTEHDLPPFIYRMRMLGYPPGWLPSNHDSGIVIHGKDEKVEATNCEEKSLDHENLVQYPGFNVPVPQDMKDLSNDVRLPRMNPSHQLQLPRTTSETTPSRKHGRSSEDDDRDSKRSRLSRDMDIDSDSDVQITSPVYDTPNGNFPARTPVVVIDLEDGEISDSSNIPRNDSKEIPENSEEAWWIKEPLVLSGVKGDNELSAPPPFPLRPLPLHKISQILPGDMNHISFEDRNLWLDPIFGNLQIRTGRYDRLKTILACRDKKKK